MKRLPEPKATNGHLQKYKQMAGLKPAVRIEQARAIGAGLLIR